MSRDGSALEVVGKSVEDAIEKGLEELGLTKDQVDVKVRRSVCYRRSDERSEAISFCAAGSGGVLR